MNEDGFQPTFNCRLDRNGKARSLGMCAESREWAATRDNLKVSMKTEDFRKRKGQVEISVHADSMEDILLFTNGLIGLGIEIGEFGRYGDTWMFLSVDRAGINKILVGEGREKWRGRNIDFNIDRDLATSVSPRLKKLERYRRANADKRLSPLPSA